MVFAGGGAKNPCLVAMVREAIGADVLVPGDSQMVGAHGAALIAAEAVTRPASRGEAVNQGC